MSATRVFAIEGLLDGRNLTVRGEEGRDALVFQSGGVEWRVEGEGRSAEGEAWCDVGEWDGEIGERKASARVSLFL